MRTQYTKITWQLAGKWLQKNKVNRPIDRDLVEYYIKEMRAGRWRRTHQGIAFDTNGVIVDGQHRLHAIFESKLSVFMNVTEGLEPEAFRYVDTGKVRKHTDTLQINVKSARLATYMISILTSRKDKMINVDIVAEVMNNLKPFLNILLEMGSKKSTRAFSSPQCRLVAILRMIEDPNEADYIIAFYKALVELDGQYSPLAANVIRHIIDGGKMKQNDDFRNRMWRTFDPTKKLNAVVQLRSDSVGIEMATIYMKNFGKPSWLD